MICRYPRDCDLINFSKALESESTRNRLNLSSGTAGIGPGGHWYDPDQL
jgi:hypothetical protein